MLKFPFLLFWYRQLECACRPAWVSLACLCRNQSCQVVSFGCLLSATYMSCRMPCFGIFTLPLGTSQYPSPALPYSRGSHGHICLVIECREMGNCALRSLAQHRSCTPLMGLDEICALTDIAPYLSCFAQSYI